MKCRKLIESPWYRANWGSVYSLASDQNAKDYYENNKSGRRVATSIGGGNTGEGGDRLVIDDPHEAGESKSEVRLEDAIEWYKTSMSTRANDPKKGTLCLIGQRVHHADLTAFIIDVIGDKFDKLILPAEYESPSQCTSSIGFVDPRIKDGELIWPDRYSREYLTAQRQIMGSANYTAQYQQRPTALGGSVFKREWFGRRYVDDPYVIAAGCHRIIQSWDCAFKAAEDSSYVVGQVWGVKGVDRYLLAERREHLTFSETRQAIIAMRNAWPTADLILIEDKANGTAIIDDLRRAVSGIVPVSPEGSKEARAQAVTPECESGNVVLPSVQIAPWIDDYLEELCQFPRGRYNDRVDATSQALTRLKTMLQETSAPKIQIFEQQSRWNTSQWGMR
jgi:predicted phage terminase large subunit-like protein